MGKLAVMVAMMLSALVTSGCGSCGSYERDFKGRVVDAETGEPLGGVVVLGIWETETPTAGGAVLHFHDARETQTDEKGEFSMTGVGLVLRWNLLPMQVLLFKAGYEEMGPMEWDAFKEGPYSARIKWDGERAIIPLRRLTMEERKKRMFTRPDIPHEKMKLLTKEVNKERTAKGLNRLQEVE